MAWIKAKRLIKKTLKITGISLLVLVVLAITLPYLFKGRILKYIKTEANNSLYAKVDFADVDISIFRHFPKLSVGVSQLRIVGIDAFAKDTLLQAKKIDVSMDLISAIKGKNIQIYSINLIEPTIHALINDNGLANWSIVRPDTASVTADTASNNVQLNLKNYAIENGNIIYRDESSNTIAEIKNLNHQGSGNLADDIFKLKTQTTADVVNFSYAGISYLNKAAASIKTDIDVDSKNSKFIFASDEIKLNGLQLSTNGFFQLLNDSTYAMDINFEAPSTDFKNILSFVPTIYQNNFDNIKTSGKALFNGFVKGNYSSTTIPAYAVNLAVSEGYFKYPDLPMAVQNINLKAAINNPDGITDHTVVNISQAHIEFGTDPLDFSLLVKNPVTNLFVDAVAKGKIDLSNIKQFVKLEAGTQLKGLLNADAALKGNTKAIENKQYEAINAMGNIALNQFFYASKDYPTGITLNSLLLSFNPKNVTLSNAEGKFMNTSFAANGYINNLLPYILQNQPLEGLINFNADKVNLNEWMGVSTDTTNTNTATSNPFVVPANLNLALDATVGNVHYDKLDITDLTGSLMVSDETITFNNIKGNALDGNIGIGGNYSTKTSKTQPDIALNYAVNNVDIQKTFFAFNTVQKLMPIGKFLAGKLSSSLNLSGKLGENMMPDLSTLSGIGNVLMIEGVLNSFQPVENIAKFINVKALSNIAAKDVKTFFELTNGNVLIKPFSVKVKDIEMEIGGLHGLTQAMDYTINMKVPRALMGDKANSIINNLSSQASNKGVPIKVGEIVPIQVKLGGTITAPTIKTDLKQTSNSLAQDIKQQTTTFANAKIDSAKLAIKDTLTSAKNQLLKDGKDQLTKKLFSPNDTTKIETKKNLEDKGKKLLKNLFNKKE